MAAFVVRWVRWVRSRGAGRRQLAWFTAGATTMVLGMVTDLGGSVLVEVAAALAIFGTLLVGMAWPLLGPLGRAVPIESTTESPIESEGTTVAWPPCPEMGTRQGAAAARADSPASLLG